MYVRTTVIYLDVALYIEISYLSVLFRLAHNGHTTHSVCLQHGVIAREGTYGPGEVLVPSAPLPVGQQPVARAWLACGCISMLCACASGCMT